MAKRDSILVSLICPDSVQLPLEKPVRPLFGPSGFRVTSVEPQMVVQQFCSGFRGSWQRRCSRYGLIHDSSHVKSLKVSLGLSLVIRVDFRHVLRQHHGMTAAPWKFLTRQSLHQTGTNNKHILLSKESP